DTLLGAHDAARVVDAHRSAAAGALASACADAVGAARTATQIDGPLLQTHRTDPRMARCQPSPSRMAAACGSALGLARARAVPGRDAKRRDSRAPAHQLSGHGAAFLVVAVLCGKTSSLRREFRLRFHDRGPHQPPWRAADVFKHSLVSDLSIYRATGGADCFAGPANRGAHYVDSRRRCLSHRGPGPDRAVAS